MLIILILEMRILVAEYKHRCSDVLMFSGFKMKDPQFQSFHSVKDFCSKRERERDVLVIRGYCFEKE